MVLGRLFREQLHQRSSYNVLREAGYAEMRDLCLEGFDVFHPLKFFRAVLGSSEKNRLPFAILLFIYFSFVRKVILSGRHARVRLKGEGFLNVAIFFSNGKSAKRSAH